MQAAYEAEDVRAVINEDDAEGAHLSRAANAGTIALPEHPGLGLFAGTMSDSPLPSSSLLYSARRDSSQEGRLSDRVENALPVAHDNLVPVTSSSTAPISIENLRRADQAKVNKRKRRIAKAASGDRNAKLKVNAKAVVEKGAVLQVMTTSLDVAELPTAGGGAFTGYPVQFEDDDAWTEERLLQAGFQEIDWKDG